jgi:Raf kinase inhibitor-like YbhB/YbcL family protein
LQRGIKEKRLAGILPGDRHMLGKKLYSTLVLISAATSAVLLTLHAEATWDQTALKAGKEKYMFQLKSNAFSAEGTIPARFTCEGENISPDLDWSGAPQGTRTFALVLHDPDAPRSGGYTHWVVFNIPATVTHLPEDVPKTAELPVGGVQGKNDDGSIGYTGPCPPSGTHRYYFHLYAVDRELELKAGASKEQLEDAIRGHILAEAEFMGRYKKGAGKAA